MLVQNIGSQKRAQAAAVRIQLHTGRTHQIRVHFEAIGCSLLGDEMYHGKMDQGIERQALHCMELILLILLPKKRFI